MTLCCVLCMERCVRVCYVRKAVRGSVVCIMYGTLCEGALCVLGLESCVRVCCVCYVWNVMLRR